MMISVALFNKFSIIRILSETFAPPIIAVNGFSAVCKTFSALTTSASINNPNIFLSEVKKSAITDVDA